MIDAPRFNPGGPILIKYRDPLMDRPVKPGDVVILTANR